MVDHEHLLVLKQPQLEPREYGLDCESGLLLKPDEPHNIQFFRHPIESLLDQSLLLLWSEALAEHEWHDIRLPSFDLVHKFQLSASRALDTICLEKSFSEDIIEHVA